MKKILSAGPFFLFLLPIFVIIHGNAENFGLIAIRDSFLLLYVFVGAVLGIWLIFYLLFENFIKAGFLAFLIFSIYSLVQCLPGRLAAGKNRYQQKAAFFNKEKLSNIIANLESFIRSTNLPVSNTTCTYYFDEAVMKEFFFLSKVIQ